MTFYDYIIRYMNEYDHVSNSEKTILRYCFEIKRFVKNSSIEFRNELNRDIELLVKDEEYRFDLEIKLNKNFQDIYRNGYSRILKILSYYSSKKVTHATSLIIDNNEFRLIDLFILNKNLTLELKKLLSVSLLNLTPMTQRTTFKNLRKLIIDSNSFSNSNSLEELADKIDISVKSDRKTKYLTNKLRDQKTTILIGDTIHDITRYYKLNPIVLSQYNKININLKNKIEFNRFFRFSTILNKHCENHPEDELKIKKYGILALVKNEYEVLIKLRSYLTTKEFNYVVFIVEILTGEKFNHEEYDSKCLYIMNQHQYTSVIRLAPLYKKSANFSFEFYQLFKQYLSNLKYAELNVATIKSNISNLKNIFIKFSESKPLENFGLKILTVENQSYFREIKSKINEQVILGKLSPNTKFTYFFSLKWFCEITKQNYLKDYDESRNNSNLAKRDLLTNSYNQTELMDILGCLIKAIKLYKDDCSRLLVAYFALIQITTGMNISTLCSLENTNKHIVQDPINKNIYIFKFKKARANHATETHIYFKNSKDKTLYLFLFIRDKLRQEILKKAINTEFKTDYFFIFLSRSGEVQVAHHENIVKKVNELLVEVGCNIRYNSKRMRKTVSNRIYKIVLNRFSVYRELLQHDFDIFVRHYEELNITESNEKIAKGTKALEIYLKNREICFDTPEINTDNIIQFTPLGNCSEPLIDGITGCSDYLACVFCKNYSVVNSEAQIHKLLDFKNICISQMMNISSSYNEESVTRVAITEFKSRIDYILNLLKQEDPKLYNLATINYLPNQYFSL
ncbi:hypothetical protein [Acinetobacter gerneri]|uniref:hypothetical protein n=1 Tax=Acinetobacter gerneri TaxID=202952 RepID=UPI003A8B0FDC